MKKTVLALPLGELSPKVTERACRGFCFPLSVGCADNSPKGGAKAVGTDDPRRSAARRYGLPHSPRRHRAPKNGQKTYFSENTSQFFTKYSTPE